MFSPVSKTLVCLLFLLLSVPVWALETHWIDVRSADEFEAGHVEWAVNIPHTEIAARIAEVTENRDARLYLYCRSGRRSGIAGDVLTVMGFTAVENVGGLEAAQKKAAQLNTP